MLPAERKGGPARDKGGEWAAADASRGPAMAVAVPAGGRAQAVLPGEAALRRARAFSEVMTDNVSLQRTGWGAKWPGTLAHARAKANTRRIAGRGGGGCKTCEFDGQALFQAPKREGVLFT